MLVDDIGDVTITNDGATILRMLEVEHPAAKVMSGSLKVPSPFSPGCCFVLSCFLVLLLLGSCWVGWASRQRGGRWNDICCDNSRRIAKGNEMELSCQSFLPYVFAYHSKYAFMTLFFSFYQRGNDLVRNKIHPTSIISGYRVSFALHNSAAVQFQI